MGCVSAETVQGRVEIVASKDAGVRKRDYSGVVVWLDPASGVFPPIVKPAKAIMQQRDKKFVPHVLAVTVGARVAFPNEDPIFHNAFSNFNGQIFDVGLYKPGASRTVVFNREGIVRVFCNIHPQMSAVIVVLGTPYFAVSARNGVFEILDVPPGDYQFHVFHERAAPETLDVLTRRITVEAPRLELPALVISESGYLPAPHRNKYGKDYPPVIEEQPVYPGANK